MGETAHRGHNISTGVRLRVLQGALENVYGPARRGRRRIKATDFYRGLWTPTLLPPLACLRGVLMCSTAVPHRMAHALQNIRGLLRAGEHADCGPPGRLSRDPRRRAGGSACPIGRASSTPLPSRLPADPPSEPQQYLLAGLRGPPELVLAALAYTSLEVGHPPLIRRASLGKPSQLINQAQFQAGGRQNTAGLKNEGREHQRSGEIRIGQRPCPEKGGWLGDASGETRRRAKQRLPALPNLPAPTEPTEASSDLKDACWSGRCARQESCGGASLLLHHQEAR